MWINWIIRILIKAKIFFTSWAPKPFVKWNTMVTEYCHRHLNMFTSTHVWGKTSNNMKWNQHIPHLTPPLDVLQAFGALPSTHTTQFVLVFPMRNCGISWWRNKMAVVVYRFSWFSLLVSGQLMFHGPWLDRAGATPFGAWDRLRVTKTWLDYTGLILSLHPVNERRRYKVTPSLIGWAQI